MRFSVPSVVIAGFLAVAGPVFADDAPPAGPGPGGPAVNSTVFRSTHIKAVTSVTEVFGRSQRLTAVILQMMCRWPAMR